MWILHFEKLPNLPHDNLVNILGGHEIGINIHGCQPNIEMAIYALKTWANLNIYTGSLSV